MLCGHVLTVVYLAFTLPVVPSLISFIYRLNSPHFVTCRFVIHTVGPRYNIKYKTAAESALFSCYRSVMKIVRWVISELLDISWEIL